MLESWLSPTRHSQPLLLGSLCYLGTRPDPSFLPASTPDLLGVSQHHEGPCVEFEWWLHLNVLLSFLNHSLCLRVHGQARTLPPPPHHIL